MAPLPTRVGVAQMLRDSADACDRHLTPPALALKTGKLIGTAERNCSSLDRPRGARGYPACDSVAKRGNVETTRLVRPSVMINTSPRLKR